jgi:two-component system, LytTR family, sensor histidine kinase AlgZ
MSRAYLTCQLAGWTAYSILGLVLTGAFQGMSPGIAATNVISCVVAALVTHGMRAVFRRRRWLEMGVARMLPRLLAASVVGAVVIVGSALLIGLYATHAYVWQRTTPTILLGATMNWLFAMLLWVALYVAIHFFRHFRLAEIRRLQLEVAARDAQLDALAARIHPHFFFNAMNSLRALISEDPARARDMATEIADLMRYALQAARREQVRLDEELAVVESYLRIESVRFESRLRWTVDAAGADPGSPLPPMLLQTLVENAVKHGVATAPEGGDVEVRAAQHNGVLELSVTSPGRLDAEPGDGFGLELSRERLRLLHGDRATLSLSQLDPARVRAVATLPAGGTR